MTKHGSDLREDRRRGRTRFDDETEEPFRYSRAPQPVGRTRPKQFGVCNPPQTLAAIIKPKGKAGRSGPSNFSAGQAERQRQTGAKQSRTARKKEQRALKAGKKGGSR